MTATPIKLRPDSTQSARQLTLVAVDGAVAPRLDPAPTADGKWQLPPSPTAGLKEWEWLEKNMPKLGRFAGLWVAIKGRSVRASSDDLEEVLDWLADQQIVDALVTQIPDDITRSHAVIA